MSEAAATTPEPGLGRRGEAEWARLRRQLEFAQGFWLGFVFCSSPAALDVLQRRTENVLRARARRQLVLSPHAPPQLVDAAGRIVDEAGDASLGCVWLAALAVDDAGEIGGPWEQAWDRALLALNQAREPLRRRVGAGLLVAAPPRVRPRVREAAPDLWSIRAMVIDLDGSDDRPPGRRVPEVVDATGELALRPQPSARAAGGPPDGPGEALLAEVRDLMRQADRLIAVERAAEAVEIARDAVAIARAIDEPGTLAAALSVLSEAERVTGDNGGATDHVDEAIELLRATDDHATLPMLLDRAGTLAQARGDSERADGAFTDLVAIARRRAEGSAPTSATLRDVSVGLNRVGNTRLQAGDLAAATAAYEESLTIRRRLLDTYGDAPEALRDVSVSLDNVGDTRLQAGDLAAATAAYDESLTIRRRLLDTYGETPQALGDLQFSLNIIATVRRESGEGTAAEELETEASAIARRLRRLVADA